MPFFKLIRPRQFNYKPRYYRKPEEETDRRIKIGRSTQYRSRSSSRRTFTLIILFVIVIIIVYLLGGIRKPMTGIEIGADDAAGSKVKKTVETYKMNE